MRSLLLHFRAMDWALIVSAVLLVGFGLISIYSSSLGRDNFFNFEKQIIFFGIAILLMFLFSFADYRIFKNDSILVFILYIAACLALAGVLFFAPEIRGKTGWYKIGPVSIDPIEFMKLVLLILLAKYFSRRHFELYRISHIALSGMYILLPAFLIFIQPDLGSVLILIGLWLAILCISGIKLRAFFLIILCGIIVAASGWSFLLQDYQQERILSFLSPGADPLGAGWSQIQAKIAIGSGGILGQGLGNGPETQYGFLPEPQTDFIFASIAEEFGLIGVFVLLVLFAIFILSIISFALNADSNFVRLFAAGLAVVLMSQIFINIGMNLGFLPVIGIPLPLVSYGGSGLIMIFIALGVLQNMRINR